MIMGNEKNLKRLVIGMAVVAVILAAILAWIWVEKNGMVKDLTVEKDQLTTQMIQLRDDYGVLTTNNDSLNAELDREREKVDQLIERIKTTEATNRSKIREYEKELGTLRSIMRTYIQQIDSLNTLNISLRKDVAVAKDEAKESRQRYDQLITTTEEYAKKVEVGSVLKGRGFVMTAINSSDKDTDRSSRAAKLKTCLNLVENTIAIKGPRRIYIRVKGPDGILMTNSQQQIFTSAGEQMIYSAVREVDYQGSELEVCIFFASNQPYVKGVYTVDVFTEESKLGSTDLLLR
jgi:cell division protein FtsB